MDNIGFYVTAIDTPDRKFLMLGPFDTKEAAEAKVKAALERAYELDTSGRAWFMAWGASKLTTPNALPAGRLNPYMEVTN